MKNNDLFSVKIPVYNVEEFLPQFLDSVLEQAYKNIELLVVDDGSTDSSGAICDEYYFKDIRIKVMHKPNVGLSSARNSEMSQTKGEQIFFIDTDDWIKKDAIEKLLRFVQQNNCEIVQSIHYYVYQDYWLLKNQLNMKKPKEAMKELIIDDRIKILHGAKYINFFG